jgi:hypothetical protein
VSVTPMGLTGVRSTVMQPKRFLNVKWEFKRKSRLHPYQIVGIVSNLSVFWIVIIVCNVVNIISKNVILEIQNDFSKGRSRIVCILTIIELIERRKERNFLTVGSSTMKKLLTE